MSSRRSEVAYRISSLQATERLKQVAKEKLDEAAKLCSDYPDQTESVADEVSGVRQMLKGYVSDGEMRMVVAAMEREFRSTGHWYRCVNGHPFTVGECGRPMQESRCPQCGAAVGGQHHQEAAGVTRAGDIETEFGSMRI